MRRRRHLVLILAASVGLLVTAASASAATTCHGLRVTTKAHGGHIVGSPQRDVILLTRPGVVNTGAGDDIVCGSSGADQISTGSGSDIIIGGKGNDAISAGRGADHIYGEGGSDRINAGLGRDFIVGGAGVDRLPRQSGDTISNGLYAVSLVIDIAGVAMLRATGQQIALALPTSSMEPEWVLPITATGFAMPRMGFGLGQLGAYFCNFCTPVPEQVVEFDAQTTTGVGASLVLDASGSFVGSGNAGSPDSVTIMNASSQQFGSSGLMQQITSDEGSGQWGATMIAQNGSLPNTVQTFTPQSAVAVFALEGSAGQLISGLPSGTPTVVMTPANPTAEFRWDPGAAAFVAG